MRIPLGTSDYSRSVAQTPAVALQNRYYESDPTNTEDQVALLCRPGVRRWLEMATANIRAIFSCPGAFEDALFVVAGAKVYSIETDETVTEIGTLTTSTGSVSMAATDFPDKLYVADGVALNLWDGSTFAAVTVPDGDGIVSVGYIARFVICVVQQGQEKNGLFYWIEPGDITIDPLNFATAERSPDPVWEVKVVGDQFWLPGKSTNEVWYPTGDAAAPLLRQQGRLFDKGIWEGTIVQIDDVVMAVGSEGNVYEIGAEMTEVAPPGIVQRIREAINAARTG